jgi:predicted enzyme related to lactoylglutathione lyase
MLWSDDLDATVRSVENAGGTVTNGPYAFPGGRRFHFRDPAGNELGVYQTS